MSEIGEASVGDNVLQSSFAKIDADSALPPPIMDDTVAAASR